MQTNCDYDKQYVEWSRTEVVDMSLRVVIENDARLQPDRQNDGTPFTLVN